MIFRASRGILPVGLAVLAMSAALGSRVYPADETSKHSPAAAESSFHHGEWPFTPPVRPAIPRNVDKAWAANPIDRFILSRLEKAGLHPSPEADRATLLRRVTYDLTGLPPTLAELDAFLADHSDKAYSRVVDRLLASPRLGERWAQHWLDLVRYADTEGFKTDALRENAFRYRDYVIDSFNSDRPFDEFVRQQLAGDELAPDNPDAIVATGFLRLYPDEDNAADLFQRRQQILDDVTDTTGLVFLGLTIGCAQCHDHKFDDIQQTDYYRLQAFFAPMAECDDRPLASAAEVAAHDAAQLRWETATESLCGELAKLTRSFHDERQRFNLEKYEPAIRNCFLKPTGEQTPLEKDIARMMKWRLARQVKEDEAAKQLPTEEREKLAQLKHALAKFDSLKPKVLPKAMAIEDISDTAPATHVLDNGNWKRQGAEVGPGFPEFLGSASPNKIALTSVKRHEPTTGRRTQLAYWLTRPDNPLTARVIVNRLWQQHFGRGIVATPNDFGSQGEQATHPELLDWLAVELIENGWSLKHIHRLMVTSATYRMTSIIDPIAPNAVKSLQTDHDNKLLWRANRRRLEGEAIRDSMLLLSGELNFEMHGPSARPALPAGVSVRYAWQPDEDAAQRNRRSAYVLAKRNLRYPLFEAFDQPDLHQSCPRRAVSVTASQSLAMLNSELTLELARKWAEHLRVEHSADVYGLIRAAYRAAYCREATDGEIKMAEKFMADGSQTKSGGKPGIEAVSDFCHAVFNSNEFISVD